MACVKIIEMGLSLSLILFLLLLLFVVATVVLQCESLMIDVSRVYGVIEICSSLGGAT